jgi:hypothetical protein
MSVKASKVQFKLDGVVVHPIPNKSDLSPDETCNIWYTKDDYRDMKDDNELLLTALKVNHKAIRIYCYRGLEYKLESFGRRRQSNTIRAVRAVIDEQTRQQKEGEFDPEVLATVYQGYNVGLRKAIKLARKDAYEAAAVLIESSGDSIRSIDLDETQFSSLGYSKCSSLCWEGDMLNSSPVVNKKSLLKLPNTSSPRRNIMIPCSFRICSKYSKNE